MAQAHQNDNGFNPYIEQLGHEIIELRNQAGEARLTVTKQIREKWAEYLLNSFSLGIDNVLNCEYSLHAIAKILSDADIVLPVKTSAYPKALLDNVLEGVALQNVAAASHLINIRFAFITLTQGVQQALTQYAADLLSPRVAGVDIRITRALMQRMMWLEKITSKTVDAIARATPFNTYDSIVDAQICLTRTIHALNFDNSQHDYATQRLLATRIIVPWITKSLARKDYSTALRLEGLLYGNFVRRVETEDHYQQSYRLWATPMEDAGKTFRTERGDPKPVTKPDTKPLVAFFVHRASMLAHIQVLHTSLKGLGDIAALPYRLAIYIWSDYDPAMEKAFNDIGVSTIWFARTVSIETPEVDRMLALRQMMERDGVQVMVWMCLMHMKGFAFGLGLAPRQIYWSTKFQVGAFDMPDDRINPQDSIEETTLIDGKTWRSVPMVFPSQQNTLDLDKLAQLRTEFGAEKIILGTMARDDILNSPPFINAVAKILKANSHAIYFYTGRENLESMQSIFQEYGVTDQTRYVGWVDTVTYANFLDIYLDPWPARSGMTAFNAFEAAKPFVSLIPDDGAYIQNQLVSIPITRMNGTIHFAHKHLDALFDDTDAQKRFFPVVQNEEDYIQAVQRLLDDPELRRKTGAAYQQIGAYLSDAGRAGRRLDKILRDNLAIAEKA